MTKAEAYALVEGNPHGWLHSANSATRRRELEDYWSSLRSLRGQPLQNSLREMLGLVLDHPQLTEEGRAWLVDLLMNGWP